MGLAITPRQRILWREIRRVAEDDLREVAALSARARAVLAGDREAPPRFFDPAHGPSARDVVFAPSFGGGGSIGRFDWLDDLLDPTDLL